MQITLVQAEIEQAITNYIHSQINVRDGHEIKVDLAATRGQAGFTATIDIVPAEIVAQTATLAASGGAGIKDAVAAAKAPTEAKSSPRKAVEPETQEQVQEPVQEDTQAPETDPNQTNGANAESGTAESASAEEQEPESATPARSLFAGLKKPVNS